MNSDFIKILNQCYESRETENRLIDAQLFSGKIIRIYPRSVQKLGTAYFFIGKDNSDKLLWVTGVKEAAQFEGTVEGEIKRCPMNHHNAVEIQRIFSFAKPGLIGGQNSIGCGDRLGFANPGHIRAVAGTGLKPVLAQQSVRELERTKREAEDVIDAAVWAVFQEGYKDGFGADGDHLKTTDDIDRYAKAGFTMFTLDIGMYVVNDAARLPISEIRKLAMMLPWNILKDSLENTLTRYKDKNIIVADGFIIRPTEDEILRTLVKYGSGIGQTVKLTDHLRNNWSELPREIELSVDETDTPTSPLEHLIVASELNRLGIKLMSLAPRFVGDFEKGIEYKGDLKIFREEYIKHLQIAEKLGPYKISIHSGSDKFDIYNVVGSVGFGNVHIKTAGTSWLEALRTVASAEPELFRKILDCARENYDNDRKSYHVTADIRKTKLAKDYSSKELAGLLSDDNARQILHVTFGTILSKMDEHGKYLFKDKILKCLNDNEDKHYEYILKHFRRHIDPVTRYNKK